MTTSSSPEKTYLTDKEVASHFNVSTDSIRRWIREGHFPKPMRIGTGTSRWLRTDIEAYGKSLQPAYLATHLEIVPTFFGGAA